MKVTWALTQALSPLSRPLGSIFASHLWFTPWRLPGSDRVAARRREWLEGTRPFTVVSGDVPLQGFTAGEGPPVLLIHGWADEAASLGAFVRPLVAAGFAVTGVDMPAHGSSPGRKTDGFQWTEAIEAVAGYLGPGLSVVAHSMGGLTSATAIARGLEVERAVFVSPAVRLASALARFRAQARLNQAAVEAIVRAIEKRFGSDVWDRFASDHLMAGSDIHGLVIHDEHDDQVELDDIRNLTDSWPGARLVLTQGLGHNRILRDPDVIDEVVAFLSEDAIHATGSPPTLTATS